MPHRVARSAAAGQRHPLRLVQVAAAHREEPHKVVPEVGGRDDAARQEPRLVGARDAFRGGVGCLRTAMRPAPSAPRPSSGRRTTRPSPEHEAITASPSGATATWQTE